MNWSSVKNLLIVILLAANIFMLFNIVRQDRTRNYIDEEEVENAVALLAERGLIVQTADIPLRKFKTPIYESFYSDAYYDQTAKALTASEIPLYMQPDGVLAGMTGDGVSLLLDPEFGFLYVKTDKIDEAAYTDSTLEQFESAALGKPPLSGNRLRQHSETARAFLEIGESEERRLTAQIVSGYSDPESGLDYLLAYQRIDDYPIHSHWAVLIFDSSELLCAKGRWYFADADQSYISELQNQINILFTDLATLKSEKEAQAALESPLTASQPVAFSKNTIAEEDIPFTVTKMSVCYIIYWNADKTALYFIPAWELSHIGQDTLVYNAVNGTLYARS